ncbi:TetR family transcriptional regulator [Actinoplanes sp. URMC 104]|uniref:TetR family transcriptional regulator n=1 Tax=Actinoplanes sp. URMC 104 TaxID=3423409 RepID=UPI003F195689
MLAALRELLEARTFDSLSVAEIIAAAEVSRASFYFYFAGKQAALAELVRRAVDAGHQAAQPWVRAQADARETLRAGVEAGAELWLSHAGVLRAMPLIRAHHASARATRPDRTPGVHRDHHGHGYGRAITVAAAAALQEMGASRATVCTPSSNAGGVATYVSAGSQTSPTSAVRIDAATRNRGAQRERRWTRRFVRAGCVHLSSLVCGR